MLILTTIRADRNTDPKAFIAFNWESTVPAEKHKAGKLIADALYRNFTVMSRRITSRLPHHMTAEAMPSDYFTRREDAESAA